MSTPDVVEPGSGAPASAQPPPAIPAAPEHLPPLHRPVSVWRRLPLGIAGAIVLILALVVGPTLGVNLAAMHGISVGVSTTQIALIGGSISILVMARYVAKPTRAFGPLWIAADGAALVSFLFLSTEPAIMANLPNYGEVTVSFGELWFFLALVPGIRMIGAILTTIEDIRHPGERMPFDFPLRRKDRKKAEMSAAPPAA